MPWKKYYITTHYKVCSAAWKPATENTNGRKLWAGVWKTVLRKTAR